MNKLGGYMAVSAGFGIVTSIVTRNMAEGIIYGMTGGLLLVIILKKLYNR